jgi:hypothetical protein
MYCNIEGSFLKKLYLLSPLLNNFFQVDHLIQKEMFQLKKIA